MIATDDIQTIIDALRLATGVMLETALQERVKDHEACSAALQAHHHAPALLRRQI
jgi:hypothetical protein